MDKETFWNICRCQPEWGELYRRKQMFRHEVRKIIDRKQKGKGGVGLKENILRDLKSTLFPEEIEIIEDPEVVGLYSIRFLDETHLLDRSKL